MRWFNKIAQSEDIFKRAYDAIGDREEYLRDALLVGGYRRLPEDEMQAAKQKMLDELQAIKSDKELLFEAEDTGNSRVAQKMIEKYE